MFEMTGLAGLGGMAALGVLNGFINAGGSALQQAEAYHYAKKLYSHRYRWAVSDMRKAGINPILAANGGNVSGMGSVGGGDYGHALSSGLSSAVSLASAAKEIESKAITDDKTRAETDKTNSSAELDRAQTLLTDYKSANQALQTDILSQKESALIEDAFARANINTALAALANARAENADALANLELEREKYKNLNSKEKLHRATLESEHRSRDLSDRLPPEEVRSMKRGAYDREWYKTYILNSINTGGKLFSHLKSMPLFVGGE